VTSPEPRSHLISISRIRTHGGSEISILALRGAVRSGTAPDFRARLTEAGERSPRLVVDLSGLDYLSSTGIGALMEQARLQKRRGGWLRLVAPSAAVGMILRLAEAQRELPAFPTEADALRDLGTARVA
jgi:anti-sigma B factor antagonist